MRRIDHRTVSLSFIDICVREFVGRPDLFIKLTAGVLSNQASPSKLVTFPSR
jgi:hypothetical protein